MKEKKIPMRMCLGCREMKPKKTLMRVVHGPDGSVSADPTGLSYQGTSPKRFTFSK